MRLNDAHCIALDSRESIVKEVQELINRKKLKELADPDSVLNRYPKDMFMQRSFTYIPGSEGYTEVSLWGYF